MAQAGVAQAGVAKAGVAQAGVAQAGVAHAGAGPRPEDGPIRPQAQIERSRRNGDGPAVECVPPGGIGIYGDFMSDGDVADIERALAGVRYAPGDLAPAIAGIAVSGRLGGGPAAAHRSLAWLAPAHYP